MAVRCHLSKWRAEVVFMMRTLGGVLLAAGIVLGTMAGATSPGAGDDRSRQPDFDLQAHRGGIGLRQESSPAAFENALELGVTTLELDLQITEDGQAVVTHDRKTNPVVCRTPRPPFPVTRSSRTWASSSRTSPSPRSRRSTAAPGARRTRGPTATSTAKSRYRARR